MESIWHNPQLNIKDIQAKLPMNMGKHLGISFTELGPDYIVGEMPITEKNTQPFDILHGGATCAFAEELSSLAGQMTLDQNTHRAVGLEINANHVRPVKKGESVLGRAQILHRGRTTQVWEIKVTHKQKLVAVCRMTLAIIPAR